MSPEEMREAIALSLGFVFWTNGVRTILSNSGTCAPWKGLEYSRPWENADGRPAAPLNWIFSDVPNYPGDIKAAWGLLGELKKDGARYVAVKEWDDGNADACANFPGQHVQAWARTAPLAICEAYLKAKGLWKEKGGSDV